MAQTEVISGHPAQTGRASRLFGKYIVNYRLQFKFSLIVFAFLAVAALTTWLMGHFAVDRMITTGVVTDDQAVASLKMINTMVGQTSILALAILFGLALFFSHFVAGPLYRFERVFEQMEAGDLSAVVRLRKHDELKDTADVLNRALMGLRKHVRVERESLAVSLEKVKKFAARLRESGKNEDATELEQILAEFQNKPPHLKI